MLKVVGAVSSHFRKLILGLFVVCFGKMATAQTFNGNAVSLSGGCIQLTSNTPWQAGSVFYPDTLNLNRPFDFLMNFNFGFTNANGADGMVFVLQNTGPNELGPAGGSLGWDGILNSIGVEFDTYQNPTGDLFEDHIAILRDGGIDHTMPNNLAGPIQAVPGTANIEDGQDHLVQIMWDPVQQELEVYFDCVPKLSLNINLIDSIFGGDSLVHWGVTAASGGAYNAHSFCRLPNTRGALNTLFLCEGDTLTLSVPDSRDGIYTWNTSYNLSATNQQIVEAWPTQDTLYIVEYLDACGFDATDTFEVRVRAPLNLALANDTMVCTGSPYIVDLGLAGGTFTWSNGGTTPTISVTTTALYSVVAIDSFGCMYQDSQLVEFFNVPALNPIPDTSFCEFPAAGFDLTADPILADVSYLWSTGDTTPGIDVDTTGVYTIQATNFCGTVEDSIEVSFYQPVELDLGNDTAVCEGTTYLIEPDVPPGIYLWSTGDMGSNLVVDTPGTYSLMYVDSNGCMVQDTQEVEFHPYPVVYGGLDITDCDPSEVHVLEAKPTQPFTDYVWSTGDSSQIINVNTTGDYVISAINGCSTATDTVVVFIYRYEEGYFIPNAFSPNSDGINDIYLVENFRPEEFILWIADRWGNEVFSTTNHMEGWDGNINGKAAPEGTYYYKIRTRDCGGYLHTESGYLTLMR